MKHYKGIIYAILSSAAFGIMPIFAKHAYKYGSNAATALLFRFLFAFIMLFVFLKIKKVSMKITKKQFTILFLIGTLGYTITTQTLFSSYNYLTVGLATTLHYIYPAVVTILSYLLFKEKISKQKIISLLLSAIGVYSLVALDNTVLNILGITLALISGIGYAINVISLSSSELKSLDKRVVTMYVSMSACIGMFIYGMFTHSLIFKFNINIIGAYTGLSFVSTIISTILLLEAIELIGSSSTSILSTSEAVLSIVFGIIFLGESLTLPLFIGTIFIVSAAIIIAKEKSSTSTENNLSNKNSCLDAAQK